MYSRQFGTSQMQWHLAQVPWTAAGIAAIGDRRFEKYSLSIVTLAAVIGNH